MKIKLLLLLFCGLTTHDTNTRMAGAGLSATGGASVSPAATIISSSSFGASNATTYTISSAGRYLMKDSAAFSPASGIPAISITVDNVILDLGGQTLSQGNSQADSIGINITTTTNNVIIKNGQIKGFTGESIKVGTSCTNVTIENIHIDSGIDTGISFAGSSGSEIVACTVKNCTISNNTGAGEASTVAYGIKIANSDGILIEDTDIIGMRTSSNANNSYGCYISTATNIVLKNVHSGSHNGAECCAFYATSAVGLQMYNCQAAGCSSYKTTNTGVVGYFITSSRGCILDECVSIGHRAVFSNYGVYLSACTGVIVQDCKAQGHSIVGSTANAHCSGFYSDKGVGNVFDNCEASGNTGSTAATSIVTGFRLTHGEYQTTLNNCIARGNGDISTASKAYGFWIRYDSTTGSVRNCQIKGCSSTSNCSSTTQQAIGFYDDQATSSKNLFIDNYAYGNTVSLIGVLTTTNYSINMTGTFNVTTAGIGSILNLASKPLYYNVDITA
jgi:ribosomal protein L24